MLVELGCVRIQSRVEHTRERRTPCLSRARLGIGFALLLWAGAPVLLAQDSRPRLLRPEGSPPRPIELLHDKPYVSVMVNGRGPFRFLIDTGTGEQALISPAIADELALPVVGHARLTDPSGQGEQRSDILLVHSLSVAGVEFTEIRRSATGSMARKRTARVCWDSPCSRTSCLRSIIPAAD